jgi:hypothetical protein
MNNKILFSNQNLSSSLKLLKQGLFSPAAETCAGGNFLPELATLKSVAKYLVWLTFCYFIAS